MAATALDVKSSDGASDDCNEQRDRRSRGHSDVVLVDGVTEVRVAALSGLAGPAAIIRIPAIPKVVDDTIKERYIITHQYAPLRSRTH